MGGGSSALRYSLKSEYEKELSRGNFIKKQDGEYHYWSKFRMAVKAFSMLMAVTPLDSIKGALGAFISLLDHDGNIDKDKILLDKMKNICKNANNDQTADENISKISAMMNAMKANRAQKTYEEELSKYKKTLEKDGRFPFCQGKPDLWLHIW